MEKMFVSVDIEINNNIDYQQGQEIDLDLYLDQKVSKLLDMSIL